MAMSLTSNPEVYKQYPIEKIKRFWYPNRPIFTLVVGLAAVGLGVAHVLPVGVAMWIGLTICADDIMIYPLNRTLRAATNLSVKRKQFKSILTLITLAIAAISGALLGLYLMPGLAIVHTLLAAFITTMSLSPTVMLASAAGGALIFPTLFKCGPTWGLIAGSLLVSIAALIFGAIVPFAPIVEITFLTAITTVFVAALLIKATTKLYNYFKYGHTNADGYNYFHTKTPIDADKTRADMLGLTKNCVTNLRISCLNMIKAIKKSCHFGQKILGFENDYTNVFKNIFFLLMTETERRAEGESLSKSLQLVLTNLLPILTSVDNGSNFVKASQQKVSPIINPNKSVENRQRFDQYGLFYAINQLRKYKNEKHETLIRDFSVAVSEAINVMQPYHY